MVGFEGLYEVSSHGRVRNIRTGRIFTGGDNGHGYRRINLKGKKYLIHRLVALAFLPNPDNLPEVNHRDENKENNNVENLEWCTASYNTNYSSHKRSCRINQLTLDGEFVKVWKSSWQIERETGYYQSAIIECCKGKYKQAYGYHWEYVDPSSQVIYNRPVTVYKGNEYIGTFANAIKASKALGLCDRSVYYCLRGRSKSNKGYTFEYKQDPQP